MPIDVPSCFSMGKSDGWIYQKPGELERMQDSACRQMLAGKLDATGVER